MDNVGSAPRDKEIIWASAPNVIANRAGTQTSNLIPVEVRYLGAEVDVVVGRREQSAPRLPCARGTLVGKARLVPAM